MLVLVFADAPDDPVEAVGFAGRARMRNDQLGDIGVVPHHLLDFALSVGVAYVSADENLQVPVVDVADRVKQCAPEYIGFLPSREHQRKRLLALLRHLLETRTMTA